MASDNNRETFYYASGFVLWGTEVIYYDVVYELHCTRNFYNLHCVLTSMITDIHLVIVGYLCVHFVLIICVFQWWKTYLMFLIALIIAGLNTLMNGAVSLITFHQKNIATNLRRPISINASYPMSKFTTPKYYHIYRIIASWRIKLSAKHTNKLVYLPYFSVQSSCRSFMVWILLKVKHKTWTN